MGGSVAKTTQTAAGGGSTLGHEDRGVACADRGNPPINDTRRHSSGKRDEEEMRT